MSHSGRRTLYSFGHSDWFRSVPGPIHLPHWHSYSRLWKHHSVQRGLCFSILLSHSHVACRIPRVGNPSFRLIGRGEGPIYLQSRSISRALRGPEMYVYYYPAGSASYIIDYNRPQTHERSLHRETVNIFGASRLLTERRATQNQRSYRISKLF